MMMKATVAVSIQKLTQAVAEVRLAKTRYTLPKKILTVEIAQKRFQVVLIQLQDTLQRKF